MIMVSWRRTTLQGGIPMMELINIILFLLFIVCSMEIFAMGKQQKRMNATIQELRDDIKKLVNHDR